MNQKKQLETSEPGAARLVLSTFPDLECARQIGTLLVDAQLIACINLIPAVESIYRWEGELRTDSEVLGILKTSEFALSELEQRFTEEHPYEVPEFLVFCPDSGSDAYLEWIKKSVKKEKIVRIIK